MEIVPLYFSVALLTQVEMDAIQAMIVGEFLTFEKNDTAPTKFHNSYLEKGTFLINVRMTWQKCDR